MAKGTVNKVILIGRLGADPDVRYTQTGDAIASFTLATSEGYKDKNGQYVDQTEWHTVKCWRKLAETVGEYVRKGHSLYVEGKLKTEKWQGEDGKDKYKTYILANEINMLSSKAQGEQSELAVGDKPKASKPKSGIEPVDVSKLDKFEDDDIPF